MRHFWPQQPQIWSVTFWGTPSAVGVPQNTKRPKFRWPIDWVFLTSVTSNLVCNLLRYPHSWGFARSSNANFWKIGLTLLLMLTSQWTSIGGAPSSSGRRCGSGRCSGRGRRWYWNKRPIQIIWAIIRTVAPQSLSTDVISTIIHSNRTP